MARLDKAPTIPSPDYRAYYTIKDGKVVFLLCGGDKATQIKDIDKARTIMNALE